MVNIPKIVLKSQTRLTLNERFTQFAEQQEARLQMLKNDLRTRIVEESYQTGNPDSAELSKKLDRLTRDIDNPERHAALFSKKKHRPRESHRSREPIEVHEEPIVPAHRPLLYQGGKRNGAARKDSRNHSRLVTYGDVLGSSSDSGRAEVSHWRAEALRGVEFAELSSRNSQKYENPLYRDSDDETAESGGGSGGASVHSRLGMKHGARPKNNVHKTQPNTGIFRRRGGNRVNKHTSGASGYRQVITKEDLDRELDEYRQKGIVTDVEMGED